jgi:hypothetical protein
MAATAWAVHDTIKEYIGNKLVDFDTDEFIIILGVDASNMTTATVNAYASVTSEVSTNFGYTQGTKALTTLAWGQTTGTATFDSGNPVWTASGGSIVARKAAIYDNDVAAPVADPILCSSSLSSGDITATTGNTFTVTMHTDGIFTLA